MRRVKRRSSKPTKRRATRDSARNGMGHIFWNERIRLIDSGENVEVLAIGDSWFHYPFNNLITPLYSALAQPTVYVIGENGARADELAAGAWRERFRAMLAEQP